MPTPQQSVCARLLTKARHIASLLPPDPAWFLIDPTAPLPTASPLPPGAVAPDVYDTSGGRQCSGGLVCVAQGNPFFGFISFDHILWAWLTIFQCITMEGWTDIQYAMQVGVGWRVRAKVWVGMPASRAYPWARFSGGTAYPTWCIPSAVPAAARLSVTDLTPNRNQYPAHNSPSHGHCPATMHRLSVPLATRPSPSGCAVVVGVALLRQHGGAGVSRGEGGGQGTSTVKQRDRAGFWCGLVLYRGPLSVRAGGRGGQSMQRRQSVSARILHESVPVTACAVW